MKKLLPLILLTLFFIGNMPAQLSGVHWTAEVYRPSADGVGWLPDKPVDVDIILKRPDSTLLFKEHHTTTLDKVSRLSINIGSGILDPSSPVHTATEGLLLARYFCYTIIVHDGPDDLTVMGNDLISEVPASLTARIAEDSKGLGGMQYLDAGFVLNALFDTTFIDKMCLLAKYFAYVDNQEYQYIRPIDYKQFLNFKYVHSAVDDELTPCVNLGTGNPYAIVASMIPPKKLESYYTLLPQNAQHFYNGLGVQMPSGGSSLMHATAAIYGENTGDPQGDGVHAVAAHTGVVGEGVNGLYGQTMGSSTGYGVWGIVADAPGAGQTKAGIFGKSQGNNNYSMMSMGRCVTTSAWEVASDMRLKRDIHDVSGMLDKINLLHPASYQFIQDSPLQLARGLHYGFLAQEMEKVFPEIVSDVTFPESSPSQNGNVSENTTYKAIAYTELIPMLTAAIQELNAKVDAQASEIEMLKAKLEKK